MRHAAILALLLAAPTLLPAAQSTQPPLFRSGIDLVDVAVLVSDADGRFVPGLAAADFEIEERGVPQTITVFDRVSIPVWRAEPGKATLPISSDTASNDRPMDGRLYVLVLDALHVAPPNVLAVRTQARQFVVDHVGPGDLVAVLSPGALAEASQDFTADKARLVRAIDNFSGNAMRSATLQIEDERQAAERGGVAPHAGRDPEDGERFVRAASIAWVLEAVSEHLSRIRQRRKALLLFSEGVDYNTGDIMGGVQRYASDVQRAMQRAIGALMRSNVSLYAIDPRRLASLDRTDERVPYRSVPETDITRPSLEGEYRDSIASLRNLSESTGGFAAVATNEPRQAFDRIVSESSDYYVLGYVPSTKGKPGEFQPIRVRVNRPGLKVVARNGYIVPAAGKRGERASSVPTTDQAQDRGYTSPFAFRRSGSSEGPAIDATPPPTVPKGLHDELAWLLSSPLPVAGLPIRVQATAFKGGDKKQVVQVITEVRGSSLAFAERRGRYESRIELASFTVDSRGRGANGTATTIDLRLAKEECERARASGIRWMSQLELAPGRYQLRVAARTASSGAAGLVTADVDVPPFAGGPALSGVAFTSANAALLITRGQARLASTLNTPPTVERTFVAGDRVIAAAEAYLPSGQASGATTVARVERTDGSVVLDLEQTIPGPGPRTAPVAMPIDTSSLAPGRYVLRMRLETAGPTPPSERVVPFEIVARERQ